ncbi:MAG: cell division inhibitor [Flavobacteriales bacterium]|nr:cell division inhibitor [Flavobacteriaceae bacterium]RZP09713.1 MAG: cell division inhibitor [Flavobacteriales bacterium]
MKIYQINTKQNLPISVKEAWEFLSSPNNLAEITPKYMNFKILSGADKSIFAGQIIQYKVTPVLGITLKWVTEITHVKQNEYFVDEQRFGPYSLWHHKHFIKEIDGGIEMEDIVDYKIPFGFLGQIAHSLFIEKKLRQIFNYREKKLVKLFGKL